MRSFTVDRTEFGIDQQKSRLHFAPAARGKQEINLSIHGDPRTYQALTEAEGSEWSWTLYPPEFYLRGFPVPSETPFSVRLTEADCEDYDVALYLMEHFRIVEITVTVTRGPQVEVRGKVELSDRTAEFAIRWVVEGGA